MIFLAFLAVIEVVIATHLEWYDLYPLKFLEGSHMSEVSVTVDGMELVGSPVIHLAQPNFELKVGAVPVKGYFINDGESNRWEVGPDDDQSVLALKFYNFKSRAGVGRLKPIYAGGNSSFKLYVTFFIKTISVENDERIVTLNIFKRDVADE
jgi:hypothetical protein